MVDGINRFFSENSSGCGSTTGKTRTDVIKVPNRASARMRYPLMVTAAYAQSEAVSRQGDRAFPGRPYFDRGSSPVLILEIHMESES